MKKYLLLFCCTLVSIGFSPLLMAQDIGSSAEVVIDGEFNPAEEEGVNINNNHQPAEEVGVIITHDHRPEEEVGVNINNNHRTVEE